ncbi:NAD-dependent histone deacetylase HST3 OS=Saccharomyces cerevisiae (strain ATCC 204508 / S288c) GN=HST3 PE=1 SV=1 [Rhizoctonia solani AG-1 IB]|uniref:NAD-dependent histone deacetylase HST3 n=1 Tax=Thanatephorus cucumeris (strain AG1-IB / isolate 7/3/14) TaxID=1108050 RepID=A0A0B7F540_THACB|nr:NAD-dependent histone deacetylase HST3 OS=Saccharomyces cerevisiae (strain ATCC 204508 / S288c) GN=HST3 PE=1 SV=1 [Rhizoctonia solani AG-1 IB]
MSSKSFKDHPVAAYQPKDHQKQRSFIIPTISYDQPTDKKAYHQVQRACGAASHVVVVCGAGISTNAGIPDFRSADGLYNKALPGLSKTLGPEMFDARVLQDREKLLSYGRAMGSLRIASKRTSPTVCHNYIAKLHEHGRLLHCYTQNVDGLQTSNHPQLAGHVLELHGNIHQVQCNQCGQSPDEDPNIIDQLLLKDGYVRCEKCGKRGDAHFLRSVSSLLTLPEGKTGAGSKWNLRSLPPGLLLPKVLHNEGSWEIELDGKLMDELEQMDSVASLLYILGTSIRTDGAAKLIRALAKQVHNNNGIVVYVDRQALRDRKLASYFDLQIQSDLDVWAKDACQSLNNVSVAQLEIV